MPRMTSRRGFLASAAALLAVPAFADDNRQVSSFAKTFAELTPKKNANGESRPIVDGVSSTTGVKFEAHQTTLLPGKSPHPPHRHKHDELFLVRTGTVEYTVNGKSVRLGPGSAALAANNDEHGVRNVGTVPAQYFVVAIGKD
jgi:mannose-6-phosphate isomerase-like protein (cupin superfamily)